MNPAKEIVTLDLVLQRFCVHSTTEKYCNNGSVIADILYHKHGQFIITLKYVISLSHIKGHIKFNLAGI